MDLFPCSYGFNYILLAVDYISKRLEAKAIKTDDAKIIARFVRSNIFVRFGVPRVLISDKGTHFCNKIMETLLKKYVVQYRTSTTYHP